MLLALGNRKFITAVVELVLRMAFDPHKGPPTQTSDSVCGGERRSSGTRELLPQAEAKDVELANAVIYKLFT